MNKWIFYFNQTGYEAVHREQTGVVKVLNWSKKQQKGLIQYPKAALNKSNSAVAVIGEQNNIRLFILNYVFGMLANICHIKSHHLYYNLSPLHGHTPW
jgi:hypothetical protein